MLNKHQILGFKVPPKEIEAFGGTVYISAMTGAQRDKYETMMRDGKREELRAWIAANTICDADGNLLFTEADIKELNKVNYKELDKVLLASLSVNELDAKAIEELKKTLEKMTLPDSPKD